MDIRRGSVFESYASSRNITVDFHELGVKFDLCAMLSNRFVPDGIQISLHLCGLQLVCLSDGLVVLSGNPA